MNELARQFIDLPVEFSTDKDPLTRAAGIMPHTYLGIYSLFFEVYREQDINVCEIGVLEGDSVVLWNKYFQNAHIYGFDLFGRVNMQAVETKIGSNVDHDRLTLVRGNSTNKVHTKEIPECHVIIDDGNHEREVQTDTYNVFRDKLHKDGIYIIEDVGWTNNRSFDPKELGDDLGFHTIDMRYNDMEITDELKKYLQWPYRYGGDNALLVYYDKDSKYADKFDSIIESEVWKTDREFSGEYVLEEFLKNSR